jgi:cytochrome bd-type quinol oxidase subunit 2
VSAVRSAYDAFIRRLQATDKGMFLEPRDHAAALRILVVLIYALVGLTLGFTILSYVVEVANTPRWWILVPVGIVCVGVIVQRRPPGRRSAVVSSSAVT